MVFNSSQCIRYTVSVLYIASVKMNVWWGVNIQSLIGEARMREMKRVKTIDSEITKKKSWNRVQERVRRRLTIINGVWVCSQLRLGVDRTTSLDINWYGPEQMTIDMVRNERDPRTVRSVVRAS